MRSLTREITFLTNLHVFNDVPSCISTLISNEKLYAIFPKKDVGKINLERDMMKETLITPFLHVFYGPHLTRLEKLEIFFFF